eukprot:10588202-Ditylum_brightwellii.AAC.1
MVLAVSAPMQSIHRLLLVPQDASHSGWICSTEGTCKFANVPVLPLANSCCWPYLCAALQRPDLQA